MSDIFGYSRNRSPRAVMSSDESILTVGSIDMGGGGTSTAPFYLVQNWNLDYQQQVQEIQELGSSNVFWMRTAPQGQGAFQSIVGPDGKILMELMPRGARNACEGGANFDIRAGGGFCAPQTADPVSLSMQGVLITSLGFQMTVQDHMLRDSIQFRFGALAIR